MKISKRKWISLTIFLLVVLSATGGKIGYDISTKKKNQEKYALYYSYIDNDPSHAAGVFEIYCWESLDGWECGILPTTSRLKYPDEVEWMQDNLPCPLNTMKEILRSYPDRTRKCSTVYVVSIPPKEEELTHDTALVLKDKETYRMLYKKLGIPIPPVLNPDCYYC